jgi:transposase-like protein
MAEVIFKETTMAAHQQTTSRECKQEAVRLLHESGKKQTQAVHELGISESSLWRWRTQDKDQSYREGDHVSARYLGTRSPLHPT